MTFHHFKHKRLEPINVFLVQCNCLEFLHKDLWFYESMTRKSNYMQLCIQLKHGPRDMGCELFMHFSFFISWFKFIWSPQNKNCLNDSFATLEKNV
jgi:hypothetical protein